MTATVPTKAKSASHGHENMKARRARRTPERDQRQAREQEDAQVPAEAARRVKVLDSSATAASQRGADHPAEQRVPAARSRRGRCRARS